MIGRNIMYLDLEGKTLPELREEAKKLGIKRVSGIKKDELLKSIKIAIHEINLSEAAEKAQNRERGYSGNNGRRLWFPAYSEL